jgi:hypothetical protein
MVKEQHTRMAKNSKVTNQPKQNQSETSQNATGAPLPPPPPPQHGQRRRSLSHLLLQPISEPKISLSSKHEKSTSKGRARGGEKKGERRRRTSSLSLSHPTHHYHGSTTPARTWCRTPPPPHTPRGGKRRKG